MRNLGIDQILLTRTHRTIPLQHWVNLGKPGEDTLKLAHIPVKFEWSLLTCHFNKLIPMVTTQNSFPEVSPAVKSILLSLIKVLLLYHFLNINNHLFSSTKISNSFSMCYFISNFFFFSIQRRSHHLWHQLMSVLLYSILLPFLPTCLAVQGL